MIKTLEDALRRISELEEENSSLRTELENLWYDYYGHYQFRGSIGNIYQSYDGQELYPTLEEKVAHLLYFVTKNHSFYDGNKRITAAMFLYFLDKNGVLFMDGRKLIDDYTLVALTIMIVESRPDEMEMMIIVIMNSLKC